MKQQSKIKFSIGKKLLIYFLLISLIPVIILGIISYSVSKKHLEDTIIFSLSNLAQDCGRKISYYVNSNYQNIKVLSQTDVFEGNNNRAKQKYIEEVIKSFPDYIAITVIDLDGKIIACTRKDLIGNSRADRDWFKKTLQCKQGEVVPLDVYKAETADWKMVLGYNTPITNETNKKIVGVLTTRVNMDHIIDRVQTLGKRIQENNHAFLLNRKGEILAGPDEKDFLTKYCLFDYPVIQKLLRGNTGISQYANDRNEKVISAYYSLQGEGKFDGWGWGLIVTKPIYFTFKSAFIIRNVTLYLLLMFSFIVIILAFVFSKTIINPINKISKAAQQISKGDLNQHLEVVSSNEIGELADSFNDIQESLQEITGKARIIAGGNLDVQVKLRSQKDELAISLNKMVRSLQESDKFTKAILNSTQAGVVLINSETHIIEYVNPVAEKMIGAEKEKIIGKICYKSICTASEGQCPITDKGITIYNEEKNLLTAKGEKVPVLNTVKFINIGDKKLLIETFVDISKLKQAEITAKRNEESFRRLFEQSNDAVFIHTILDEKILDVNKMACKLTGYSKEELLSMTTFDLRPDNIKTKIKDDSTTLKNKDSIFIEMVFQKADGSLIDVEISAKFIDKKLDIAQGIVRDITQRKQFEKELKERSDEIEKQNWIKTGQNELNKNMRGEQDISSLSGNIIKFISKYSGANIGGFYILNEKGDELILSGNYAYSKNKNTKRKIKIGEGLIGQAAIEKEMIIIKDLPEDYLHINSVLGDASPLNVIISPFILNEKVIGIIELGAFKEFSGIEIEFLKSIMENIAIGINSAKIRTKMKELADKK